MAVVLTALIFDFVNGFHDTANAIATVVATKVLPLGVAIFFAAVLNFVGAVYGGGAVAGTITKGIVSAEGASQVLILSALISAIFWGLVTWYYGIPSSSSHAIIGGLLGAALAKGGLSIVQVSGLSHIVMVLITSPLMGFTIGFAMMVSVIWVFHRSNPKRSNAVFHYLQMLSAGFMAVAHGNNDAQKSMGIITLALVAYGIQEKTPDGSIGIPRWVVISCALAMALGTASGGKRIIRTMGTKIIELRPVHGFAAETSAAITIFFASHFGLPVSTTHVISASIMGVGSTQNPSAVRWGVALKMVTAWVLTVPVTAFLAGCMYYLLAIFLGA